MLNVAAVFCFLKEYTDILLQGAIKFYIYYIDTCIYIYMYIYIYICIYIYIYTE